MARLRAPARTAQISECPPARAAIATTATVAIEYPVFVRAVLSRVVRAAFSVAGAPDPDAERRARLLLVMAAAMLVLLVLSGATIPLVRGNAQTWLTLSPIGVLAMLVTFALARRGRADAGAMVLSVFVGKGDALRGVRFARERNAGKQADDTHQ